MLQWKHKYSQKKHKYSQKNDEQRMFKMTHLSSRLHVQHQFCTIYFESIDGVPSYWRDTSRYDLDWKFWGCLNFTGIANCECVMSGTWCWCFTPCFYIDLQDFLIQCFNMISECFNVQRFGLTRTSWSNVIPFVLLIRILWKFMENKNE